MQKRNENAIAATGMPQCATRYRRGKETMMIQDYGHGVQLFINLDTDTSRLMAGDRLVDIYQGTTPEKMRRITAAAEGIAQAKARFKSSYHARALS